MPDQLHDRGSQHLPECDVFCIEADPSLSVMTMAAEAAKVTTAPHNSMHGVNYFPVTSPAQITADKKYNLIKDLTLRMPHFNAAASRDRR